MLILLALYLLSYIVFEELANFKLYSFVCMCVCVLCACTHIPQNMCGGQRAISGYHSFLPPCGVWGLNSGSQARGQVALLDELSPWPSLSLSHKNAGQDTSRSCLMSSTGSLRTVLSHFCFYLLTAHISELLFSLRSGSVYACVWMCSHRH